MLKQQELLSQCIEGVETKVQPYGFEHTHKGIKLISGSVHVQNEQETITPHLYNCYVGWVGPTPILRTSQIDSKTKANAFLTLGKEVYCQSQRTGPFRLCSNQINSVEYEWDGIVLQHQYMIHLSQNLQDGESLVHISTEMEKIYATRLSERKLKWTVEALEKLPKLVNMEGWADYCAWYSEKLERAFSHFLYDAMDEYTLERYLKDFQHEVFSVFLQRARKRLLEIELKIGINENTAKVSSQELMVHEKELIIVRNDMQRMIRAHYDSLVEIIRLMVIIKEAHPELVDLLVVGQVFRELLARQVEDPDAQAHNWCVLQMLLQLLNDDLGVISAVNCNNGIDRTNLAFAMRLAILQMKRLYSRQQVVDMVLNWEKTARIVNKQISQNGEEGLHHWLKSSPNSSQEHQSLALAQSVVQCRRCILSNLENFGLPITRWNSGGRIVQRSEGAAATRIPLNFIPSHHTTLNATHEQERVALVNYDPETGAPVGLTDAGHCFLMALSYSSID